MKNWALVVLGLLAAPMSARAADLATSIDGGINAGVRVFVLTETADLHSAGFVGAPTSLNESAHAADAFAGLSAEGFTTITATWTTPDQGSITYSLDGGVQGDGSFGSGVFNSPGALVPDWHYTFVPKATAVFRLGYSLTGHGDGAGGYLLKINGVDAATLSTPQDGTTLVNSSDFPLVAGQTYTVTLANSAGISSTGASTYDSSATFSFEIISPAEDELADLLQDVIDLNVLVGTSNALQSKLKNALAALERGDTQTAISLLKAFINSVEAQRGKALTDAEADALIAAAQEIIDSLSPP